MILLSKVFPTLDCASCISTPKMARHHPPSEHHRAHLCRGGRHPQRRRRPLPRHDPAEAHVRRRGALHRLPALRDGLQRGRARPVQRRHGVAPRRVHRLPAGGAQEGGDRARRHLAVHVQLPRRDQGARLRLAGPQRRVREGVQPRARGDAAGRQPGPRLLRAVRGANARGAASKGPLPIRRLKRFVADTHYAAGSEPAIQAARAERQAGRRRRFRAGRPHRRLAAGAAGLRRQDLRGRARAGRHAAPGHPRLPAAERGGRATTSPTSPRSAWRSRRTRKSRTSTSCKQHGFDAVFVATGTHESVRLRRSRRGARRRRHSRSTSCARSSSASPSTSPASTWSWSAAATSPSTRRAARAASARRPCDRSASSRATRCPRTTSRSRRRWPRASSCTTPGASSTARRAGGHAECS